MFLDDSGLERPEMMAGHIGSIAAFLPCPCARSHKSRAIRLISTPARDVLFKNSDLFLLWGKQNAILAF
jgi:hypothetical protein